MPRKPLIYTHLFPYHVMARSNNQEWFYLPTPDVWNIFVFRINEAIEKYKISVHLFVLMSNHYHMLVTCHEDHSLGEAMAYIQKSVSRDINKKSGRINHIFGGPYKACLIRNPAHYFHVYKYVARNPVTAKITTQVETYRFSTLYSGPNYRIDIEAESSGFSAFIPETLAQKLEWLNSNLEEEHYRQIRQGLTRTEFPTVNPKTRRKNF